jgi:spore germination cell wall hydrolase CwlJ-like protein
MFAEVCMMNKQFSCWNGEAGKSLIKVREHKLDKKEAAVFRDCLRMAKDMMEDRFVPPVKATHYHSTSVSPGWARSMVRVVKIGNHVFYRV